eukprot:TRINITY_DN13967_c0_g1_i1.p1 TRINITY_DN13967_c0_g1~~TRINITY_DN13967_c0_g1_i1.p1  ORF type:complete len:105 (+),score=17.73 TRINITY_DN13967_c0_g1_i1:111-425(+)
MCIRDSSTTDTIVNIDKVSFMYQRKDGYVNRACGFKMEFDNLESNLENEGTENWIQQVSVIRDCLLYTSDAADDLLCVDLGGRRIIKKKKPECKRFDPITTPYL